MYCEKCKSSLTVIDVYDAPIINFSTEKNTKKFRFNINLGNKKIGNKVLVGELEKAYYCDKCNRAYLTYRA